MLTQNLDFYNGFTKEELRRNSEKNRGTMKKEMCLLFGFGANMMRDCYRPSITSSVAADRSKLLFFGPTERQLISSYVESNALSSVCLESFLVRLPEYCSHLSHALQRRRPDQQAAILPHFSSKYRHQLLLSCTTRS